MYGWVLQRNSKLILFLSTRHNETVFVFEYGELAYQSNEKRFDVNMKNINMHRTCVQLNNVKW